MTKLAKILLLAVVAAATPALAGAAQLPQGPDLIQIAQKVGLEPAQIAQIKRLALAAQRELIPIQARLRLAQLDLQEAVDADSPPAEKRVTALAERIGNLETDVKKNQLLLMVRVRATMNKTQWDKLQALHAEQTAKAQKPQK
jgi:hypothetical protein